MLAPLFADSELDVRYVSVSGNRARVEARYQLAGGRAPSRAPSCCCSRTASGTSADPG